MQGTTIDIAISPSHTVLGELLAYVGRGAVVPPQVMQSVLAFMLVYGVVMTAVCMLLLISGMDLVTAATAATAVTAATATIACIDNTGPGLGQVAPAGNCQRLSDFQTSVCTFAMMLGRLELLSVRVLFTPAFWRK